MALRPGPGKRFRAACRAGAIRRKVAPIARGDCPNFHRPQYSPDLSEAEELFRDE